MWFLCTQGSTVVGWWLTMVIGDGGFGFTVDGERGAEAASLGVLGV